MLKRSYFIGFVLLFVVNTAFASFENIRAFHDPVLDRILDRVDPKDVSEFAPSSPVSFDVEVERILKSTIIKYDDKRKLLLRSVARRLPQNTQERLVTLNAHKLALLFGPQSKAEILTYLRQLRVAFFTGVFNPIHNGHMLVIRSSISQMALDAIHVLPTVHTTHNTTPIDWNHRRIMINASLDDVSEAIPVAPMFQKAFEQNTGVALDYLFSLYSEGSVQWIHCMGADSFVRFVDNGLLAKTAEKNRLVLLIARDGVANPPYPQEFKDIVYSFEPVNESVFTPQYSSTKIRNKIAKGESIHGLVPNFVETYVAQNQLYR